MDSDNQKSAKTPNDDFDPGQNGSFARHPTERALQRYAANETGPQARKIITKHLEQCVECRRVASKCRDLLRRWRDLERVAITRSAATRL
jgi:hypothetical protein